MLYYCRNARNKIVHTKSCGHIKNAETDKLGCFESAEKAKASGYRFCKHCAPLKKYYSKIKNAIQDYCSNHMMKCTFDYNEICVSTRASRWKMVISGDKNYIMLYHLNTRSLKKIGYVPGYHLQKCNRKSVIAYLEYIYLHDEFRLKNPGGIVDSSNLPKVALTYGKSKKKRAKEEKAIRNARRSQQIRNTLNIIDCLALQRQLKKEILAAR